MKILAALALLFAPAPLYAQVYVGAHGGLSVPNDPKLPMKTNTLHVQLDDGYAFGGALGYDFGRVRVEVEGEQARASTVRVYDAARSFDYKNRQLRRSAMVNAYLDQPLSDAVTLYGGGGLGYSQMSMRAKGGANCREILAVRIVHGADTPRTGPSGQCQDQGTSSDWGFTWQGIAGLDFRMGRGWSIGPQFRYVAATGIRTAGKSTPTRETRFTDDRTYTSLNALISIRKSF